MTAPLTVLVVGATGSIGSLVVAESLAAGHRTRALVRDLAKAHRLLPNEADIAIGDVTRPDTLAAAVDGVDAIVLTLGSDGAGGAGAETRRLRRRPQRAGRRRKPSGPDRLDDRDRGHRPCRRLQPVDPGTRLETPLRTSRAG